MSDALHDDELPADATTVRALLERQAPSLAGLTVRALRTTGTVNRVFRLGDDLAVRLPRRADAGADLRREATVVPVVARVLPVAVPEPVLLGEPEPDRFDAPWSVVRWVDGATPEPGGVPVDGLVDVVLALRSLDVDDLPRAGRALAADADGAVRTSIDLLDGFDRAEVGRAWTTALDAPSWDGRAVGIHADLLPPNLLVHDGRLVGALDWGTAGVGDPANDLVPAWSCLRGADRRRFRDALAPDEGTWARASGIALAQAVVAIPYYERTNPGFAALCRATLTELLADRVSRRP